MDVRCERCKAQYVFDDDQVTPSGLAVQCTNCGHLFRVKKKELVVTVPVKPGEIDGAPVPADSLTGAVRLKAASAPPPEAREWRLRQVGGNVLAFRELTTLQKWIVEGKVGRDDQLSSGGDAWARLGDIDELSSFFEIVDRARVAPAPPLPNAGRTMPLYPRSSAPGPAAPPEPAPRAAAPATTPRAPAAPVRARQVAPDAAPAPRGGGARMAVLVALLAIAAGAAAYVYAPRLIRKKDEAVAITLETVKPAAVEPNPTAPPTPTATATATPTPTPTPTPTTTATPTPTTTETGTETAKKPDPEQAAAATTKKTDDAVAPEAKAAGTKIAAVRGGPKVLVAQAERLRTKGETSRALDLYGRAVAADPENVPALTGRGLCYLDLSRYAPAAASFEAALALAPDDADALLGLAEAYRSQGRDADAIRYYERYLAKHPDGDEAAVAKNALQELRR